MINGAHCIIYSQDAAADRTFFLDVLGLPHVDVGDGWLIFGLPGAYSNASSVSQSAWTWFLASSDR